MSHPSSLAHSGLSATVGSVPSNRNQDVLGAAARGGEAARAVAPFSLRSISEETPIPTGYRLIRKPAFFGRLGWCYIAPGGTVSTAYMTRGIAVKWARRHAMGDILVRGKWERQALLPEGYSLVIIERNASTKLYGYAIGAALVADFHDSRGLAVKAAHAHALHTRAP